MKKTLAILLALALVLCMMPSAAFAEGTVTVTNISISAIADQTYTGSQIKPGVTVTATMSDNTQKTLAATEYEVTYGNNVNVGDAAGSVIVKVPADTTTTQAEVTKTATFKIVPYDLNANKITASIDNQISPLTDATVGAKVIYYQNGKAIPEGALLTMLKDNLTPKVGTAAGKRYPVTFEKEPNLTGEISAYFDVVSDIDIATVVPAYNLTLSGGTLNAGKYDGTTRTISSLFTLKGTDGKTINTSNYTVTATDSAGKTVTSTKDAGTYKVVIKGINDYASQKELTLVIEERDASKDANNVTVDPITGKYSASQFDSIVPVVRDKRLGQLVQGKDYSYQVTSGIVTVTFQGNYIGTQAVPFSVVESDKDIAALAGGFKYTIGYSEYTGTRFAGRASFTGYSVAPVVSVKTASDNKAFSSSNYTIEYRKSGEKATTAPINAGTYDMYIVGRGSYGGEAKMGTLTVDPYNFALIDVTVSGSSIANNPNVTVRTIDGRYTFVKDKDYTVSAYYNTYSGKGTASISSTGTGNLSSGVVSKQYTLVSKSISYCSVSFASGSKATYQYTGSVITPQVIVRDGYTILTKGTDYTVTYKDAAGKVVASPREAGTYTIEIAGKGLYGGTTTLTFSIVGIDISGYTVTLRENSVKADGYGKTPTIVSVKNGVYNTVNSSDYTISYQDSTGKTVLTMATPGTYKVVVTGRNGYTGSAYATYRIVGTPQDIKIAKTAYKVYPTSDSFKISASATGDGTGFSYVSNNPSVATVDAYGNVTVHKIGRAVITVTTTGMKKSDPASDEVYVKVHPLKTTLTQKPWNVSGKSGTIKVRWNKQDEVTKYQIRYCRNSKFTAGTYSTKTVNNSSLPYETQSTSLSNLTKGQRYYIKVRAVKEVYNENGVKITYYGKWSNWRSVVVK